MRALLQDLRYGLRMMWRVRTFTAAAILSIALGIGANTTIFTVVNAVFLRPLPVTEPARLISVYGTDGKNAGNTLNYLPLSYPNYVDYRDRNSTFSALAAFGGLGVSLSNNGEPAQLNGLIVSGNYFDVLGVKAELGRTFLPEEDSTPGAHPVVVVSHALWRGRFGGDPNLLGKTLTLNNQGFTVIGVASEGFRGTAVIGDIDLWVPLAMHDQVLTGNARKFFNERRALIFNVVGRLKPGLSVEQAQTELQIIGRRLEQEYPRENEQRNVVLLPLTLTSVDPNQRALFVQAGGILLVIVGLVLLIACANVANLLLARVTARRKEMALRAALGAGRWRIMRQLLTESLLLSISGAAVGFLLAYWGRTLLWSFRPPFLNQNSLPLDFDTRVLGFTLLLSLLAGVIFGLAPALQATRTDLTTELKERSAQSGQTKRRLHLRKLLIVGQVALSLVSLTGAGLFLRSLYNAQQLDPGFETEKLVVMSFNLGAQGYDEARGREFYRQVRERVGGGGVRSTTLASNPPLAAGFMRSITIEGQEPPPGGRGVLTLTNIIGQKYFETLGIPVLRGRDINEADQDKAVRVAIINEAMARRFWPNGDALGKRFRFFGEDAPVAIVGVAGNSDSLNLGEPARPVIYLPLMQNYTPTATLYVRTAGDPNPMVATLRREVQALDPNLPLTGVSTISEIISRAIWAPRMGAALLCVFGLLALTLTAVGLYGVLAYTVNQRTTELGLRMALGAQKRHILGLVLKQGLILVLVGIIVGLATGLAGTRLVVHLLFGSPGADPVVFLGATSVLVAVAFLAIYIPARRAARIDPLVAMRTE
jgi:predicted permease